MIGTRFVLRLRLLRSQKNRIFLHFPSTLKVEETSSNSLEQHEPHFCVNILAVEGLTLSKRFKKIKNRIHSRGKVFTRFLSSPVCACCLCVCVLKGDAGGLGLVSVFLWLGSWMGLEVECVSVTTSSVWILIKEETDKRMEWRRLRLRLRLRRPIRMQK